MWWPGATPWEPQGAGRSPCVGGGEDLAVRAEGWEEEYLAEGSRSWVEEDPTDKAASQKAEDVAVENMV